MTTDTEQQMSHIHCENTREPQNVNTETIANPSVRVLISIREITNSYRRHNHHRKSNLEYTIDTPHYIFAVGEQTW